MTHVNRDVKMNPEAAASAAKPDLTVDCNISSTHASFCSVYLSQALSDSEVTCRLTQCLSQSSAFNGTQVTCRLRACLSQVQSMTVE